MFIGEELSSRANPFNWIFNLMSQETNEQAVCIRKKHWVVFARQTWFPIVLFLVAITMNFWLLSPYILAFLFVISLIVAIAEFRISKYILTDKKFIGVDLPEWAKMKRDTHHNGREVMRDDIEDISLRQDLLQRIFGGNTVVFLCKQGHKIRFKDVEDATAFTDELQSS